MGVGRPRGRHAWRYVYFVAAMTTGRIKIGIARNPMQRLGALRTANSDRLELMGVMETDAPERLESLLHAKFRHLRDRGEWFEATRELVQWIEEHARDYEEVRVEMMLRLCEEVAGRRPVELTAPMERRPAKYEPTPMPPVPDRQQMKARPYGGRKAILAAYKEARGLQ